MNLRGQGEGPVRVCDACKKLEDAARLELRSGYRHKAPKGASKSSSSTDHPDPLLKEILGQDSTTEKIENTALVDEVSKLIASNHVRSMSVDESYNSGNDGLQSAHLTPEMLLSQAQEKKQQWLALKKAGKGSEAMQAFKQSRELERQAENLKVSLRRGQRKAATSTTKKEKHEEVSKPESKQSTRAPSSEDAQGGIDKAIPPSTSKKGASKERKEKKDDLMDALKELGWNDVDLQDAGGKQHKAKTVESELAELAAAMNPGSDNPRQKGTSSMEVLAHKRKALALKKEGHLAEAKEELKKAKLLEKQLEEQQLLGGEEDESDDDLHALMREIDKKGPEHSMEAMDMDFSLLSNIHEDDDQGFEVTDVDMDDPEMIAALKLMGWEEEAAHIQRTPQKASAKPRNARHVHKPQSSAQGLDVLGGFEPSMAGVEATEDDMQDPFFLSTLKAMGFEEEEPLQLMQPSIEDKKRLQQEVLFLKKEALALKRAGKLREAKEELSRAKHLERELQGVTSQYDDEDVLEAFSTPQQQPDHGAEVEAMMFQQTSDEDTENVDVTEEDMGDPELARTLKSLGWQDDHESDDALGTAVEPSEEQFRASHNTKSKSELQKELLGIKRAALKLRREGKEEEAEEELKKALILEQLMEEAGRTSTVKKVKAIVQEPAERPSHIEKGKEEPIMLVSHKSAQYNEEDSSSLSRSKIEQASKPSNDKYDTADVALRDAGRESSSGLDEQSIQLRKTRTSLPPKPGSTPTRQQDTLRDRNDNLPPYSVEPISVSQTSEQGPALFPIINSKAQAKEPSEVQENVAFSESSSTEVPPTSMHASQQQVLALKRQALALKREGRQLEAKEKLKEAKVLERMLMSSSTMEEDQSELEWVPPRATSAVASTTPPSTSSVAPSKQPSNAPNTAAHKSASKDRMKLQQESLAHKRKALALRREGNTEAADQEFELAKSIEKQMEEFGSLAEGPSAMPHGHDMAAVEDLFDPQLLAALKGLGWKESDLRTTTPEVRPETVEKPQEAIHRKSAEVPPTSAKRSVESNEKEQLEQKIRSEKIRAVQLRRGGQQAEALEVLRGAKLLEKRLQSLS